MHVSHHQSTQVHAACASSDNALACLSARVQWSSHRRMQGEATCLRRLSSSGGNWLGLQIPAGAPATQAELRVQVLNAGGLPDQRSTSSQQQRPL